ncbi:MAG: NACHT domain-containing protein [Symploca sp. SIO2D2]|nr:NACHT domain-containing protein [Symploca sp. SIO2D2]
MAVSAYLKNLREEIHPQGTIYERGEFYVNGKFWEVGIVEVGAGNTGAALEAERAIAYFNPHIILFIGVAGGIKDVKLGDVVAATKVYGYESGKAKRSFEPRPDVGLSTYSMIQRARAEARKLDWLQRLKSSPTSPPQVLVAPIAAGEKVIASSQSSIRKFLQGNYGDAVAVEMEGRGLLQAAHANQQVLALIIRGISDLIDDKSETDTAGFREIAAQNASAFAFQILAKLQGNELSDTTYSNNNEHHDLEVLVQKLRSRLYDDIQSLHGTMPLWGVDHWVPLVELFVDINILEELSSSRRSELDDLWQDFSHNPGYRSLDRIGLGSKREQVSGLEVLTKNTNLMVVGKPGSGKTTYLQQVVTECNEGNIQAHRIPVLIKLREFVKDGRKFAYSLKRYLEQYWRLSDAETQLLLEQGRALVLLDGLDEVTGKDGNKIDQEIKQFARTYPQVQIIVTCRTQSFTGEMNWKSLRFQFVEVDNFNELQVRKFAEHWFKTVIGDESLGLAKGQEFLRLLFLEENKPIRELAITPILLSLTCAVFHQKGKFYSKRSKLYEEGLELLLENWDKSREIERDEIYRDLSVERKLELLSHLAVKKFEQEQYVLFEQEEIEGYIAELLGIGLRDSRAVLKAIEAQHGLLIERSQKVWSFSHLTFQEYLVALNFQKYFIALDFFYKDKQEVRFIRLLYQRKWGQVIILFFEQLLDIDFFSLALLVLKFRIDQSVALQEKLQDILSWAYQKSSNTSSCYSITTLRCFYISLIAIINTIDELEPPWIPDFLMKDFDDLLSKLDNNISLDVYHYASNGLFLGNLHGSLEGETALDRDLCHARAHASLLGRTVRLDEVRYAAEKKEWMLHYNEEEFEFDPSISDESFYEIAESLDRAMVFCEDNNWEELGLELVKLYNQIPQSPYGKEYQQWCKDDSEAWAEQLRKVAIQYRNIDYQWQLTEQDWRVLYAYIYANRLLMDCLEGNAENITKEMKLLILETLLIPYSELKAITGAATEI